MQVLSIGIARELNTITQQFPTLADFINSEMEMEMCQIIAATSVIYFVVIMADFLKLIYYISLNCFSLLSGISKANVFFWIASAKTNNGQQGIEFNK